MNKVTIALSLVVIMQVGAIASDTSLNRKHDIKGFSLARTVGRIPKVKAPVKDGANLVASSDVILGAY
jgi:hypothetical protein